MGQISSERSRRLMAALLLFGMTFLAYLPAMRGGYIWDDKLYLTENVTLRSAEGLRQIWLEPGSTDLQYYPLLLTVFWLQYQMWGEDPFGYHLINVALHAVNAVLLWLLLARLRVPGAFLAAAIFALHPVHVESVAWVTELKNVLSGLFSLLAVLAWVRFLESRRWPSYAFALFLFLCAMLSKSAVIGLPLILLILAWWKGRTGWRHAVWSIVPFLAIGGLLALVTVWKEQLPGIHDVDAPPLSLVERTLLVGRTLWFYAGKLFWPVDLMPIYPRWEIDARAPLQYAFLLAALAVPVGLWWSRQQIGIGPLVAVLSFAIALGPAVGIVTFDFMRLSFVADHFQYLASIGLIALVAATGVKSTNQFIPSQHWIGVACAGMVLLILGILTWNQARLYRDAETLWRHNVAKNPQAWMAQHGLGSSLRKIGKLEEAIAHYREALRINPAFAETYYNMGIALTMKGDVEEAIAHYREALRINPAHDKAHNNLGIALASRGGMEDAIAHFRQALRINPNYAEAHNNLGKALASRGDLEDAIRQFREALRIQPEFVQAHQNLGRALAYQGKSDEAVKHYEEALRIMRSRPNPSLSH